MKPKSVAMYFHEVFPWLTARCNEAGYALAQHGSLARDIDLVAVPWTPEAIDAAGLVGRLLNGHGESLPPYPWYLLDDPSMPSPAIKPHGRLAWSLYITPRVYIDLSIMPRRAEAQT